VAIGIAVFILGAAIAQAVRQDSLDPIWAVGWLPAVLIGALYRPAGRRPCWPRRRPQS
jgi:hypothetical protein